MEKEVQSFYTAGEQKKYINPLLNTIVARQHQKKTTIIGIQGGPGTGKTTLSRFLQEQLRERGYLVESFSIDDFYTSYAERTKLAQRYPDNPFYQIFRGMPGTHRVKELMQTLKNIKAGKHFTIPIFDKSLHQAQGDITGERIITKKIDFLLFDGWCVGLPVVSERELRRICKKNKIFLPSGYKVVIQFPKQYQPAWKYLDYLIMLRPVSIGLHLKWRLQQEQELQQRTGRGMAKEEISHFVAMFLPLTYAGYEKIRADATLTIDRGHRFVKFKEEKLK